MPYEYFAMRRLGSVSQRAEICAKKGEHAPSATHAIQLLVHKSGTKFCFHRYSTTTPMTTPGQTIARSCRRGVRCNWYAITPGRKHGTYSKKLLLCCPPRYVRKARPARTESNQVAAALQHDLFG